MGTSKIDRYDHVPETKEDLQWADLVTLDLSLFERPGGKEELLKQLEFALRETGFFYVEGFNISEEEINHQFALGRELYALPVEERLKFYNADGLEKGKHSGYTPAGLRVLGNGMRDNIQRFKISKFDGRDRGSYPSVLADNITEIETFTRKCHTEVVEKLLRLFALFLELPDEDRLVRDHQYDLRGEDHLDYMHYAARTPEENKKVGDLYSLGHTDLGTVTLLFRQPVAGLQIVNLQGQWRWVRPQNGKIIINTCDSLAALTGGLIKSTVHRVHVPPEDQAHIDRLGLIYFARPNNHLLLDPIKDSPVLTRLGLTENELTRQGLHLTAEEWVAARQTQQHRRRHNGKIAEDGTYTCDPKDLEIVPGMLATVYD